MEDTNKQAKLFIDGLAQLKSLVDKVEKLEDKYNISRKKVLSEDLFWSDDKDKIYRVLREHDTASSDYIKGLKKELQELLTLATTINLCDTNKEEN